jgi:hypothetical protein
MMLTLTSIDWQLQIFPQKKMLQPKKKKYSPRKKKATVNLF